MAPQLDDLVGRAAQGRHTAAMSADALSAEISGLINAHAAGIAADHGLDFAAESHDVVLAR